MNQSQFPRHEPKPGIERETAELPKRFYKAAGHRAGEGGHAIFLDERPLRTPARHPVVVPTRELADDLAEEWEAQREHIDPKTMPVTRIVNSAIDGVENRRADVAADIVRFAGSDLLSYRADHPEGLVRRQAEVWDPLLGWAREELGIALRTTNGVMPVSQPDDALEAAGRAVGSIAALPLAGLHVMTTLTGSAVIALAHARRRLSLDEAWAAAHVDEDWNIAQWGTDALAEKRRRVRLADMQAASLVYRFGAAAAPA